METAHQREYLPARATQRTDRHHERIDHDVGGGDTVIGGGVHDLLGHREPHVGVFTDAGLVVRDRDDGELREATFTGAFYPDSEDMTYTVTFEDYGTEKEITAP